MSQTDIDQAERLARELLDSRVAAVRALAEARAATDQKRAALADAEREDAAAWAAAERAGWSTAELKKVGFDPPSTRSPGRPRKNRRRPTTTSPDPSASNGQLAPTS